jgi:hypothetical protein
MYQFTMTEVPEGEAPHSDIQHHREKLKECVADLSDLLTVYLEEDILTPGEFVKCFRDALQQMQQYHQSRQELLNDCESLLISRSDG